MTLGLNLGSVYGGGYSNAYTTGYSTNGAGTPFTGNVYQLQRQGQYCASAKDSDYENVLYYLQKGEIQTALDMFEEIKQEYGESAANKGFKNVAGMTMTDAIQKNCAGSFGTGLAKGVPIIGFFTESTSEAEGVAQLSGREANWKNKALEGIGGVTSAVATGAVAVGVAGAIGAVASNTAIAGIATLCGAAGPAGWIVGGALALIGLISTFAKK